MWFSTSGRLRLTEGGRLFIWDGEKHRRVGHIERGPEVEDCDQRDLRILADEWANRDTDEDLVAEAQSTYYGGLF
jgi:hypothetical protein